MGSCIERTQIEKALLLQGFPKMRGPFFDKNVRKMDPFHMVRAWGLEPQRITAREPKSRMSTNSIMPAYEQPS